MRQHDSQYGMVQEAPPFDLRAAYVAFPVFQESLHLLRQRPLPGVIDVESWPRLTRVEAGRVVGAFRFLGLIDFRGTPLASLQELIQTAENERTVLLGVLKRRYPVDIDKLVSMQYRELKERIEPLGVREETLRRAASFFIRAVMYCDVEVSGDLERRIRANRSRQGVTRGPRARKTVFALDGGGKVEIAVSVPGLPSERDIQLFTALRKLLDRHQKGE